MNILLEAFQGLIDFLYSNAQMFSIWSMGDMYMPKIHTVMYAV